MRPYLLYRRNAAGESIPTHKHLNEGELIFLHTGEGVIKIGEKEIPVKTGSVAFIPKGLWHGIKNTGSGKLTR
jgi:mannose-6-phosphate isomerase-like protein (cupin superfamily)